jgi:hypothetical protein
MERVRFLKQTTVTAGPSPEAGFAGLYLVGQVADFPEALAAKILAAGRAESYRPPSLAVDVVSPVVSGPPVDRMVRGKIQK